MQIPHWIRVRISSTCPCKVVASWIKRVSSRILSRKGSSLTPEASSSEPLPAMITVRILSRPAVTGGASQASTETRCDVGSEGAKEVGVGRRGCGEGGKKERWWRGQGRSRGKREEGDPGQEAARETERERVAGLAMDVADSKSRSPAQNESRRCFAGCLRHHVLCHPCLGSVQPFFIFLSFFSHLPDSLHMLLIHHFLYPATALRSISLERCHFIHSTLVHRDRLVVGGIQRLVSVVMDQDGSGFGR